MNEWCVFVERTKRRYIIFDKLANGLIIFLVAAAGVVPALLVAAGVINGVIGSVFGFVLGSSICGFAIVDAARARVLLLSRLRLGASLIFGCVWH